MVLVLPKLPYVVQRSLAFLPVKVDESVRWDVKESTKWRVEMWREVMGEVPQHVLVGKGYAIDPRELDMTLEASWRGRASRWATASLARDYHSGPLSLFIPLGGVGTLAFIWFLIAGGRVLHRNCQKGDPALGFVNRLLYGYFLARVIFFLLVFGSFFLDLAVFVGLVGLGLSLNARLWQPAEITRMLESSGASGYSALNEAPQMSKTQ
jgi:hypothetical protein